MPLIYDWEAKSYYGVWAEHGRHDLVLSCSRESSWCRPWLKVEIDEVRIIGTDGYGQEKPIAPNDTEEGRAKNRRTELVVARR